MKKRPSLAFVSHENPYDKRTSSGVPYYMMEALQEHWGNVEAFYWVKNRLQYKLLRLITHASRILFKKDFDYGKSMFFSKLLGSYFSRKFSGKEFDVLFCTGSFPIAYLDTDIPIIIFTDSSFGLLVKYYPYRNHYFKKLIQSGRTIEQRGYDKAHFIVFASSWAADYARNHYICGRKIEVLPRGANIDTVPGISTIEYRLHNKNVCKLLFLGVDWQRKGGNIVVETFMTLKKRGMKVHLTILGCKPKALCDDVTVIPFINKNSAAGMREFDELFKKSHFMFVPTRAECFGIIFCEASAYGMPVISTDTGGVSEAVEEGINGHLLPLSANSDEYADLIQSCFLNEARYKELCYNSRMKFEEKLNWGSTIKSMKKLFENRTKED